MERTSSHATTERIPWLAVAVASLGYFVDLYDLVVFSVVRVPSLGAQGLGLPDAAAGAHTGFVEGLLRMGRILLGMEQGDVTSAGAAILNVQLTGMLIGGFLWGMLGDRRGRLTTLFGSIALYSTANLLNAFVHTVPQYAALRFIAGIGLAGELGAGVTLVSELMNRHHRGWGTMIVAFAGMFGPIAASLVGNWLDWRHAYMLGAIMGFGLLALRIGLSESGMFRRSEREHARRGDLRMLFLSPERLRRFACVVGLATPIWFVGGVVFVFGPELAKTLGCPDAVRPPMVVLSGYLGAAVGDLATGAASQWLRSRRKVVVGAIVMLAIGLASLFMLGGRGAAWFYGTTFVAGLATGYWAVFVTIAGETFGTNLRATVATSAPNLVRWSAVIWVSAWEPLKPLLGAVGAAACVATVALAVGLISVWGLPETYGRDLDWEESGA
jgi:predicted MFS family arabinose efflux permease